MVSELRDIQPPVSWPVNYLPILVGLLLVLIVLAFLVWKYLRKTMRTDVIVKKSPYEMALDKLNSLLKEDWSKTSLYKEYYAQLTEIIREYIERRFSLRAEEMTTEEFLSFIKDDSQLSAAHKDALQRFLNHCDMVKFAKYVPEVKEAQETVNLAKDFVIQTKPIEIKKEK